MKWAWSGRASVAQARCGPLQGEGSRGGRWVVHGSGKRTQRPPWAWAALPGGRGARRRESRGLARAELGFEFRVSQLSQGSGVSLSARCLRRALTPRGEPEELCPPETLSGSCCHRSPPLMQLLLCLQCLIRSLHCFLPGSRLSPAAVPRGATLVLLRAPFFNLS